MERCPEPRPEKCRYEGTNQCFLTTHHRYFPKSDYSDGVSKLFRQLPENKDRLPHCEHDDLHYEISPPEKPARAFMLEAIKREAEKRNVTS